MNSVDLSNFSIVGLMATAVGALWFFVTKTIADQTARSDRNTDRLVALVEASTKTQAEMASAMRETASAVRQSVDEIKIEFRVFREVLSDRGMIKS